jgi:hypothetical protein
MHRVYIGRNAIEAHLVCGLLQAAGIASQVRNYYLSSGYGELPITTDTLPSVWIEDDRRHADALAVVSEYERPRPRPPWQCPHCNEIHGGQFTACWKCGREADTR